MAPYSYGPTSLWPYIVMTHTVMARVHEDRCRPMWPCIVMAYIYNYGPLLPTGCAMITPPIPTRALVATPKQIILVVGAEILVIGLQRFRSFAAGRLKRS